MTTEPPADTPVIVDKPERQRFEMEVDGQTAFMRYRRAGNKLFLIHTEVPAALRGQSIGGRLVRAVLEVARQEGSVVVPHCPYVRSFLEKHPEYDELTRPRGGTP